MRSASSVGCAENTGELCNKQKSMISDTKIENKGPTVCEKTSGRSCRFHYST